ncbi:hypothetical protein GHT06_003775 [Daphnia sinensis]|uniref:Uncharacterized protein n=1 Tax=Daphnia sinensis TaxID=1820382 RepID=A0AAD5KDV4_9CRUS|nr:hypothetical protein GHT06_003775 [Daphnia sinensis]
MNRSRIVFLVCVALVLAWAFGCRPDEMLARALGKQTNTGTVQPVGSAQPQTAPLVTDGADNASAQLAEPPNADDLFGFTIPDDREPSGAGQQQTGPGSSLSQRPEHGHSALPVNRQPYTPPVTTPSHAPQGVSDPDSGLLAVGWISLAAAPLPSPAGPQTRGAGPSRRAPTQRAHRRPRRLPRRPTRRPRPRRPRPRRPRPRRPRPRRPRPRRPRPRAPETRSTSSGRGWCMTDICPTPTRTSGSPYLTSPSRSSARRCARPTASAQVCAPSQPARRRVLPREGVHQR